MGRRRRWGRRFVSLLVARSDRPQDYRQHRQFAFASSVQSGEGMEDVVCRRGVVGMDYY